MIFKSLVPVSIYCIITHTAIATGCPSDQLRFYHLHETHRLRDIYDGILVGINTALADDPSLTTRLPEYQGRNPVRILVDSKARLPLDSKLARDKAARTIVAVSAQAPAERVEALKAAGVEIIVAGDGHQVDLTDMMQQLGAMNITSILVEGGGSINFSLLEQGLVDRVYAFIAPKLIGGRNALTPVEGEGFGNLSDAVELEHVETRQIGRDILLTGCVKIADK